MGSLVTIEYDVFESILGCCSCPRFHQFGSPGSTQFAPLKNFAFLLRIGFCRNTIEETQKVVTPKECLPFVGEDEPSESRRHPCRGQLHTLDAVHLTRFFPSCRLPGHFPEMSLIADPIIAEAWNIHPNLGQIIAGIVHPWVPFLQTFMSGMYVSFGPSPSSV